MSPAGGSESLKENGARITRSGSLALLFTVSSLVFGTIAWHENHSAGPITAPLALGIDSYFPAPQSVVEKPQAPRTQAGWKRADEAAHDTNTGAATTAAQDAAHKSGSERTADNQVRLSSAGPGAVVASALSIAHGQSVKAAVATHQGATPGDSHVPDYEPLDSDHAFAQAFAQAAAPVAHSNETVSSIDRSSLVATAKISAPETGMGVTSRQAGSSRYVSGGVSAANRLGSVAINSDAQIGHLDPSASAAYKPSYDAVNVRTSFTVPAFHHPLQVSVGGNYERMLQTGGPHLNSLDMPPSVEGSAAIDGTGTASALNNAGRLSLNRAGYTTSVSVPVASGVNVGVGYAQRNVNGGAGLAQSTRIDERQHLYSGSVTYQGRSGRSSLMLIGRESRAVDSTATAPDTKIRRGDLVFSVKF